MHKISFKWLLDSRYKTTSRQCPSQSALVYLTVSLLGRGISTYLVGICSWGTAVRTSSKQRALFSILEVLVGELIIV